MPGIQHAIRAFAGAVPRRDDRLLDGGYGTVCINFKVSEGILVPLRTLGLVAQPTKNGQQISLHLLRTPSAEVFLTWVRSVDATPSPRINTTGRTYFVGDGEPRVTDYALATTGGTDYPEQQYVHGVFPPQTAPSVAVVGGSGTAVSRTFRYTFVNQWDEESAPSPASAVVNGFLNSTSWDLTSLETAPPNSYTVTAASWASGVATYTVASTRGLRVGEEMTISGSTPTGYNLANAPITELTATTVKFAMAVNPGAWTSGSVIDRDAPHNTTGWKQRFYVTDSSGVFKFWAEQAAATTFTGNSVNESFLQSSTYADGWRSNIFYDMPPTDMHSVVVGWNQMMFGATTNELIVFEPAKPHAAPSLYRIPIPFEIVGIGVTGQTVVIATKGNPYLARGSSPLSLSTEKSDAEWPCVAKRSISAGPLGVLYATRSGLVLGNSNGFSLITRELYTWEQWRMLSPETFVAAVHDDTYFASYSGLTGQEPQVGIVMIPIVEKVQAALFADFRLDALRNDPSTGEMHVLFENDIYRWDDPDGTKLRGTWISKEWLYAKPINMGAARVDADFLLSEAENAALEAAYDAALLANHILLGSTFPITGTTANGSPIITGLTSTADLVPGMRVSGTNVPTSPAPTVVSVDSASQVTLSANCTGNGTNTITFQGSIVRTGTLTNTSAIVTDLSSTSDLYRGMQVSGTGVPANTYIFSVDSSSQITLDQVATAGGAQSLTFLGTPGAVSGAINAAGINIYAINGSGLSLLPDTTFEQLQFLLYTDGMLRATRSLKQPLAAFRLPSGYKSKANMYGISANLKVRGMEVAETMEGLKKT